MMLDDSEMYSEPKEIDDREEIDINFWKKQELHEIGEKLLQLAKGSSAKTNSRNNSNTNTANRKPNFAVYAASRTESDDPEKQRLKYLVAKLLKEYQNSRMREQKAIEVAKTFESILKKQMEYNRDLKKSYCDKEVEIVQMREMIDELNGALQRANMADQYRKNSRGLIDKLIANFDSIQESITDKRALLDIIEQQKADLAHHAKVIQSLSKSLQEQQSTNDNINRISDPSSPASPSDSQNLRPPSEMYESSQIDNYHQQQQ